jgi:hypothetical protein
VEPADDHLSHQGKRLAGHNTKRTAPKDQFCVTELARGCPLRKRKHPLHFLKPHSHNMLFKSTYTMKM